MSTWLLPENIADVLPSEARKIEELRRRLLDRFRSYGYELVMPPMLEYLESLLTSGGTDLNLRTFKLVDQLSGRTLGLRADITPQVSRIDAHLLNRQGVTRLCYAGNVLHTRPRGLHATREQIQIGAEIYGHAGLEADLEIQTLMLDSLHLAGLTKVRLDLCHAGVLAALLELEPAAASLGEALYDALGAKDVPRLYELTAHLGQVPREALRALPSLYGDASVLDTARGRLPNLPVIARAQGPGGGPGPGGAPQGPAAGGPIVPQANDRRNAPQPAEQQVRLVQPAVEDVLGYREPQFSAKPVFRIPPGYSVVWVESSTDSGVIAARLGGCVSAVNSWLMPP